jgi:hypothetical protein
VSTWTPDATVAPVTPFWQRMPRIFALPLEKVVLIRVATVSVLTLLTPLALFMGIFGLFLMLLALLLLFVYGAAYGFTIIDRSSQGFLSPSSYPEIDENASLWRPIKYVVINLAFAVAVIGVAMLTGGSQFMVWVAYVLLFGIAMPAAVMRLVVTQSVFGALSPAGIVNNIGRIGRAYFVLCLFVFFADLCRSYGVVLLGGAGGLTGAAIGAMAGRAASVGVGTFVLLFVLSAAFWYFTYVICALIGYAMYQYSDALEITPFGPGDTRMAAGRKIDVKARARDAMIGKLVSEGAVKEAIDVLNDDLRDRPQDLSLHARLHKLLLAEGYLPRIEDHTEKYLDLLMATHNEREALPLAEEALGRNAEWRPRKTEHIVPLARAAMAAGKNDLAARLIKGFDKKYRVHADVPAIYLIGAQLMLAAGGPALQQARNILEYLVEKFPDHPAGQEGARTLERMDKLVAR